MEKRPLGRSGLAIAPIMFGGNVLGWTADRAMSMRLLDMFVDAGFDAIDTADSYSRWAPGHRGGESEALLGAWFRQGGGKRHRVTLATKCGSLPPNDGLKAAQIEAAVEASLTRLGIETIDLYQAHKPDAATPIAETLEAFARLVAAGKVRAVGCSNYTADGLRAALAAAPGRVRLETLQPEYNLVVRDGFEGALQALCVAEQVGVIPHSALAAGFLTGKYRGPADLKQSARGRAVEGFLNDEGLAVLARLDVVAEARGVTPTQVALAWLLAQPGITAAIASATTPEQLETLLAAARLTLSADELAALSGKALG